MRPKRQRPSKIEPSSRFYRGADVPMRVIRRYAREVAERFRREARRLLGFREPRRHKSP